MIILIIIGFAEEVAYVILKEIKLHNSGLFADVIDSRYCNYNQIINFFRAPHCQKIRKRAYFRGLYSFNALKKCY